jgi:hypothetical protein
MLPSLLYSRREVLQHAPGGFAAIALRALLA